MEYEFTLTTTFPLLPFTQKLYVVIASTLLAEQKQIQVISIMIATAVLAVATFYFKPHMESENKGLSSNTADGFLLLNAAATNGFVALGAFTTMSQSFTGRTIMSTVYLLNFLIGVFVCAFQVIRNSQGEKKDSDFEAICWTSCLNCCCCCWCWCCRCRCFSKRKALKSPEEL